MRLTRRQLRRIILNELAGATAALAGTGVPGWIVLSTAASAKPLGMATGWAWSQFDPVVGSIGKKKVDRHYRDLSPKEKSAKNVAKLASEYGVPDKAIYTLGFFNPSGQKGVALFDNSLVGQGEEGKANWKNLVYRLKKKLGPSVVVIKSSDLKLAGGASMRYINSKQDADGKDRKGIMNVMKIRKDFPVIFIAQDEPKDG